MRHVFTFWGVLSGEKRGRPSGGKIKRGGKHARGPPPGEALSQKEGEEDYEEEKGEDETSEAEVVTSEMASMDLRA